MASPVEDYAMIGDCHTAAPVARDGSIDWLARREGPAEHRADPRAGRRFAGPGEART